MMKVSKTVKVNAATCDEMLDAFNKRIDELTGVNSSTAIKSATIADMLNAFNTKIDELENLNSSTTIESATVDDMLNAFNKKIDELENFNSSTDIHAAADVADTSDDAHYVNQLMDKVDETMNEYASYNNITSWNWNVLDDGSISLIVVYNNDQIDEYTMPKDDVSGDIDADSDAIIKAVNLVLTTDTPYDHDVDDYFDPDSQSVMDAEDVKCSLNDGGARVRDLAEYCWDNDIDFEDGLKLVYKQLGSEGISYDPHEVERKFSDYLDEFADEEDNFYGSDVESCNTVMTATDIEQVEINENDNDICYRDVDGMFGQPDECMSLAEIKEYWNNNHLSDPSLVVYPNFDAWFADTENGLSEESDEVFSSTEPAEGYQYVLRHGLGPGTIPNDVQIIDSYEDGWKDVVTLDRMLTPEEMDEYEITYPN